MASFADACSPLYVGLANNPEIGDAIAPHSFGSTVRAHRVRLGFRFSDGGSH
jgi:hypothetical protein